MPLSPPDIVTLLIALLFAAFGVAAGYMLASLRRPRLDIDMVREQREELQAMTRRVLRLQEEERTALSRELHDDIGQAITAIKLSAQALDDDDDERRAMTIAEISHIADETVIKLRNISLLLRPPQLDALGLEAALRWQSGVMFRSGTPRLVLRMEALPERPAPAVELACFRIAQEALTNALRHGGAEQVTLTLSVDGPVLDLRVENDGTGFDADRSHGLGLVTMRERAQQLGGSFNIAARVEGGTAVHARLPMGSA